MLAEKIALVTGGSRGIGREICLELAKLGMEVVVNATTTERGGEAVKEITAAGGKSWAYGADIANDKKREAMLNAVLERCGRIDLLVNNAGVAPKVRADILEAGEESFDRLISINLKGPYFLTQLAARAMLECSKKDLPDYKPLIINISSISAYTASPSRGDYCISKAGVSMMTKLFASRLADSGINVFEIRPGIIATDMTSSVKDKYNSLIADGLTPIRRWGTPKDIGKTVAAVARGDFPFSTGEIINVDGGFHLNIL